MTSTSSSRIVSVTESVVAGSDGPVPTRRYTPAVRADRHPPVLVWAHGGGFFMGGLDQAESDAVGHGLAVRGVTVVTVDYGLAPVPGVPWLRRQADGRRRQRFPRGVDDLSDAFSDVLHDADGPAFLGGASAGACLAAASVLSSIGAGKATPRGTVLAYGFFHTRVPFDQRIARRVRGHRRLTHAPSLLHMMARNYAGLESSRTANAFPGGQDLSGFPSTLMIHADRDVMRGSGERFAAELDDAGVEVTQRVPVESRHAFLNRPHLPVFGTALDEIAAWIRSRGDEEP